MPQATTAECDCTAVSREMTKSGLDALALEIRRGHRDGTAHVKRRDDMAMFSDRVVDVETP